MKPLVRREVRAFERTEHKRLVCPCFAVSAVMNERTSGFPKLGINRALELVVIVERNHQFLFGLQSKVKLHRKNIPDPLCP